MDKTLFFHGVTTDGYHFTVAGIIKPRTLLKPVLKIGISICSVKDTFNKKRGRLISEGRLLCDKKDVKGVMTTSVKNSKDTIKNFLSVVSPFNEMTRRDLLHKCSFPQ